MTKLQIAFAALSALCILVSLYVNQLSTENRERAEDRHRASLLLFEVGCPGDQQSEAMAIPVEREPDAEPFRGWM